jgi:hypothetical protein
MAAELIIDENSIDKLIFEFMTIDQLASYFEV